MIKNENPNIQVNNEVINYINGKAIVKDDFGDLFFIEIPEELVTLGETILAEDLISLSDLEKPEYDEIMSQLTH